MGLNREKEAGRSPLSVPAVPPARQLEPPAGPGRWWHLAVFGLVCMFLFVAWLLGDGTRVREDAARTATQVCAAQGISESRCAQMVARHGEACFRFAYHFGTRSNPRTHLNMDQYLACLDARSAEEGLEAHRLP